MTRKRTELTLEQWLHQDDVLGYIVNAYQGVDAVPSRPGLMRRVFLWEEGHEVKMGNAEAFILHLGGRFGRSVRSGDASALHKLLRDLGEAIALHRKHEPRRADGPGAGRFRQPDPDEWVVRRSTSPHNDDKE